ncbi:MAG: GNAT family N-acetyltransferase [Azospirillum sp.]|nr:GNAT family N-acetyltransferase [Azospirillum sp.]
MTVPPVQAPRAPPLPGLSVVRAEHPSLGWYRYLYDSIGEAWLWIDRRRIDQQELQAIIQDRRVDILTLTVADRLAGFAELDRRGRQGIKLAYFGLLPGYIGRGLGPWLLDYALAEAWRHQPPRVLVNTCSFDHPAALALYRSRGFAVVRRVCRTIDDPRLSGLLPRSAAPQIPLAEGPAGLSG